MLEAIMGVMGSGGLGAIVGVLGSYMTKREERKQKILDNEHALKMGDLQLRELEMEQKQQVLMVDKNIDLAEAEGNIQLDAAEIQAFTESQKGGGKWMDIAKSLMRPVITIFLLIVSAIVLYKVGAKVNGLESIPEEELMELYQYIINQVIFLTVTAVTWWFAARPSSTRRTTRAERNNG